MVSLARIGVFNVLRHTAACRSLTTHVSEQSSHRHANLIRTCYEKLDGCYQRAIPGLKPYPVPAIIDTNWDKNFTVLWDRLPHDDDTYACCMARGIKYNEHRVGNPQFTLYIHGAYVHPTYRGRGICAALVGDEADVLKQQLGPNVDISIQFFASGFNNENSGRMFWAKMGAEFTYENGRRIFLANCRQWANDLDTSLFASPVRTALHDMFDDAEKTVEKNGVPVINSPWILFQLIEQIEKSYKKHRISDASLIKNFSTHLTSSNGVSWHGTIPIQPAPEGGSPFWGQVAAARKLRSQFEKKSSN